MNLLNSRYFLIQIYFDEYDASRSDMNFELLLMRKVYDVYCDDSGRVNFALSSMCYNITVIYQLLLLSITDWLFQA